MRQLRFRLRDLSLVLVLLLVSSILSREGYGYFQPSTVNGKYILLRLEDVGPGGFYGTPEGIGKLRAVIDYLTQQRVPFHIAVVSRWKHYDEQTGWIEQGIDTPTPLTESFVTVLRDAQDHGAILGMHGYSHQWGDVPRTDNQQNSGFASEFDIKGEQVSASEEYAAERIEKSLKAFEQNGLNPAFWESPHYHSARRQQEVFRSYMGLIYEPYWYQLRSLRSTVYLEGENGWKEKTLGAVYIPAPLRYVFNEGRVQEILNQLQEYHGLASMYFHPFIEFSHLEPVLLNGQPVLRDEIPVYQYKRGESSLLQQLITGIQQTDFVFGTIHDIVPFSPGSRIHGAKHLKQYQLFVRDLNQDGRDDFVTVDSKLGEVDVIFSQGGWPRNTRSASAAVWLQHDSLRQAGVPLLIMNEKTKRSDLLLITKHQLLLFANEGDHFHFEPKLLSVPAEFQSTGNPDLLQDIQWISFSSGVIPANTLLALDFKRAAGFLFHLQQDAFQMSGQFELPVLKDGKEAKFFLVDADGDSINDLILFDPASKTVWVLKGTGKAGGGEGNPFEKAVPWYVKPFGEQVRAADTNGDGKADMVFYSQKEGYWQILRSTGAKFDKIPASFGPWGRVKDGLMYAGDWDGNGKVDIGVYNPETGSIDTALSFQKQ